MKRTVRSEQLKQAHLSVETSATSRRYIELLGYSREWGEQGEKRGREKEREREPGGAALVVGEAWSRDVMQPRPFSLNSIDSGWGRRRRQPCSLAQLCISTNCFTAPAHFSTLPRFLAIPPVSNSTPQRQSRPGREGQKKQHMDEF